MKNPKLPALWKHLPEAASVAVGVLPVLVLILGFHVPRKTIGMGALAYAAGAVAIKLPVYHVLVVNVLHKKLSNAWLACSQGMVSAISELGASLCFFLFVMPELAFADLIGFGIAAGSVEAIILPFMGNPLQGTPLEEHAEATSRSAAKNRGIEWLGVLERILASFVHTAARGLVYVSCFSGNLLPAALAVAGFGSIDGRAYYAHLEKWQFDNVRVLGRFYRFLGIVAISLTFLFLLLYHLLISPLI